MKTTPCKEHGNPDLWFTEMPRGKPNINTTVTTSEKVKEALLICDTICPVRQECLVEGMKPENLPYGIWGGKLSGERLSDAGYQLKDIAEDSDEWRAMDFTVRMTPWVRW